MPAPQRSRSTSLRASVAAAIAVAAIGGTVSPAAAAPTVATPGSTAPAAAAQAPSAAAAQASPADSLAAAALAALTGSGTSPQNPAATNGTDVANSLAQANATLRALGIQPFLNPSVAFNCVAPTSSNPLGIAPAAGGAIAGPWAAPGIALPRIPFVNIDPNVVKSGETLYGFVPVGVTPGGPGANSSGMQVAWFNVSTGKGGFAAMGDAGQTIVDRYLASVPAGVGRDLAANALKNLLTTIAPAGTRLAPVATGKGTVLSAVFGTVQNGSRSCFFLPMVGVTNA